ncbi:hypothetical protein JCM24511_09414 [Saitozyma sp. JCM 24511]|nr:hypothetical protein JCM24511_09414 [Saitozyma sp. JCM 24511]
MAPRLPRVGLPGGSRRIRVRLSPRPRAVHIPRRNVIDELEARGFVAALTNPALRQHVDSPTCIYAGVDPSASSLHVGNLLPLLALLHFQAAGHQSLAVIGGATGSIGDPSGRSTERIALEPHDLERNIRGITDQVHRFFERGMAYIDKRGGYGGPAAASAAATKATTTTPVEGARTEATGIRGGMESRRPRVGLGGVKVLNNLDWFRDVSFLDFLRTVGKLAKVNVMLSRDSVKNRLTTEQGISFTEFSYQLLQAHDFAHLHATHDCRIQLGGSDQWGNIVAGIDLIKRQRRREDSGAAVGANTTSLPEDSSADVGLGVDGGVEKGDGIGDTAVEPAYGLTIPLLTTSTGEKFGKSAGNAVWLDEERTSVSDFYQFFLRSTDEDVARWLPIFTFLPLNTIRDALAEHTRERSKRSAQKLLADEVTELVHGADAVLHSQTIASVLFSSDPGSLRASSVLDAFTRAKDPRLRRCRWDDVKDVQVGKLVADLGLVRSRAEANRSIPLGSLSLNSTKLLDPRTTLSALTRDALVEGRVAILRHGTKHHVILYIED